MIRLNAQIDTDLARIAGKQVPFATSVAINRTAVGARDVVRANLPKRFRLKRSGLPSTVKAVMSTKQSLLARIVAPGFLSIHETGGTMQPTKSRLLAAKPEGVNSRMLEQREGTFRMPAGNGHEGVFKRRGRSIQLLAWLSPEHDFDERLHMADDVREHVGQRFSTHFAVAISEALR